MRGRGRRDHGRRLGGASGAGGSLAQGADVLRESEQQGSAAVPEAALWSPQSSRWF